MSQAVQIRKVRAKAPLRLGLAGGGTDLSPFCDEFGGNVLNITISVFAHCSIEQRLDGNVHFNALDIEEEEELPLAAEYPLSGLVLHRGVYNRIVRQFHSGQPLPVTVSTSVEAPPGSGLGSSSALVVAMVKAYAEYLELPLGDYDVARLAFEIERVDLGMAGGRQDQYAAAFGGCNFIEFLPGDRVIVNPLRVHEAHWLELEASLLVCHTGRSRVSSEIIENQTSAMRRQDGSSVQAMEQIKADAVQMKLRLLRGDVRGVAEVLNRSWDAKKRTARSVSNDRIDGIYQMAIDSGAWAGKISGAGGGGFMMLMVPPERKPYLARALAGADLTVLHFQFTHRGAESWTVQP
jgi:D-glycero-alpha-D-manno-heptose-7-phosphate kinase